ncbi:MAG: hypothetical protein ACOYIG_01250 [Acetivibrionales bacterium]
MIFFLVFSEILRKMMSASENVATSLEQAIIMIAAVAILSVIEQIIKDKVKKMKKTCVTRINLLE